MRQHLILNHECDDRLYDLLVGRVLSENVLRKTQIGQMLIDFELLADPGQALGRERAIDQLQILKLVHLFDAVCEQEAVLIRDGHVFDD
jgi:hypothetical protein